MALSVPILKHFRVLSGSVGRLWDCLILTVLRTGGYCSEGESNLKMTL